MRSGGKFEATDSLLLGTELFLLLLFLMYFLK